MKKDILAGAFLVLMIGMIAAGCRVVPAIKPVEPGIIAAVAKNQHFIYDVAGIAMMVIGGLTAAFGGKATGLVVVLVGVAICWTGSTIDQYPQIGLAFYMAMGLVILAVAYDRWRLRKGAGILALSVENAPHGDEVKENTSSQGAKAVKLVRRLIDPAKEALKAAGKI